MSLVCFFHVFLYGALHFFYLVHRIFYLFVTLTPVYHILTKIQNLKGLTSLVSNVDIEDELYQRVDVPLKVGEDSEAMDRKVRLDISLY